MRGMFNTRLSTHLFDFVHYPLHIRITSYFVVSSRIDKIIILIPSSNTSSPLSNRTETYLTMGNISSAEVNYDESFPVNNTISTDWEIRIGPN